MQRLREFAGVLGIAALLAALAAAPASAAPQAAQSSSTQMTSADVERLQGALLDANAEIDRLRSQDAQRAEQLQARLDDLRDEAIYLKVKQRKEGPVARSEYGSLRDRIDDVRTEARRAMPAASAENRPEAYPSNPGRVSEAGAGGRNRPSSGTAGTRVPPPTDDTAPPRQSTSARPNEVPAGTEIDVRLESPLSSGTAQVEDRFTATTVADLYNGNKVLIPAGSTVRGVVTDVAKAGRIERKGRLTLAFDRVTVNGRSYPLHGTVEQALESGGYREDAGKIGAGAGVGAIIGGILGGMKGALAGILIGGGGVVAATEGQDVNLPAGTVLRIRLDSGVTIR